MSGKKIPVLSLVERLPGKALYAPLIPVWFYFALRYRGLTVQANANPGILTGGLCGESKSAVLRLLGEVGRAHLSPFVTVEIRGNGEDVVFAMKIMRDAGLAFPVVAKPDIGRNGKGVKVISSEEALKEYLAAMPRGAAVMLQRYENLPGEAGVFFVRLPWESHGRLTSLTLKQFPTVVGDGHSTIRELIMKDERASRLWQIYFKRNLRALETILPEGEPYRLISLGNHARGAVFIDGAADITPAMTEVFDRTMREMSGVYFGRFDVRFKNLDSFKRGKDFYILEFNGIGSEPTHIYDRRVTIWSAYRAIVDHWYDSFRIGRALRARGDAPVTSGSIISRFRHEVRLLAQYPDEE